MAALGGVMTRGACTSVVAGRYHSGRSRPRTITGSLRRVRVKAADRDSGQLAAQATPRSQHTSAGTLLPLPGSQAALPMSPHSYSHADGSGALQLPAPAPLTAGVVPSPRTMSHAVAASQDLSVLFEPPPPLSPRSASATALDDPAAKRRRLSQPRCSEVEFNALARLLRESSSGVGDDILTNAFLAAEREAASAHDGAAGDGGVVSAGAHGYHLLRTPRVSEIMFGPHLGQRGLSGTLGPLLHDFAAPQDTPC